MKNILIVHFYIYDHKNNITEVTTQGWTHEELAEWVLNMYGEIKIRHFDEKNYGVTIYTYNDADTKQIKEELQNL